MLEGLLDALTTSAAFERLLTDRARPLLARADAGEDFVVSALARTLESPVLVVAAGPREAEPLVRGVQAWLGAERAAYLAPWEALPYEGIGPSPEVAAGRAEAVRRLRAAQGAFVLVTTGLAAMQGLVPTLGRIEPVELAAGAELAPDDLADRLVALGYSRTDVVEHRGEFAVRGRRPRRLPRNGPAARPPRVLGRRDRVAPRVRRLVAAVVGSRQARPRPAGARAHRRRRAPGARGRARAQVPRPLPRRPPADRGRAPRRGRRVVRAAAVRRAADARRAAAGRRVGRGRAGAPDRRPRPAGARGGNHARRGDPVARPAGHGRARGGARRRDAPAPHRVHGGDRPRPDALGDGAGQSRRAREARGRPAPPGVSRRRRGRGARVARARARGPRLGGGGGGGGAPAERVRLRGRAGGGGDGGGRVRRPAAHADRPAAHLAPPGRHRGGARARRLRRPPRPRRRPVRRHPAPRDRRLRARLHGPRVRAGRPVERPDGLGRHGGALRRRRRAEALAPGFERLGPRDRPREARRQGHGRRARAPVLGPDVRRGPRASAPTRRGRASSRTPSRTSRPATRSRRSRRSRRTCSGPGRWTA